jgi:hypothetical protein
MAIFAVVLTAFLSSFFVGLGVFVFSILVAGWSGIASTNGPLALATIIWFFGFFTALLPASLMAIVEWPKARKMIQSDEIGIANHMFSSIVWASILPFIIAIIAFFLGIREGSTVSNIVSAFGAIPLFALGGLCSSLVWQFTVVKYGRSQSESHGDALDEVRTEY